jgi:hypothetical protein
MKQTVKLVYKMYELVEIEAPDYKQALIVAATKLMKGELEPKIGKGELQKGSSYIEREIREETHKS